MNKVGEIVKEITAKSTVSGYGNGKEKEAKMLVPAKTEPEPSTEVPKPDPGPKKVMTLQEKIQRIENLKLVIEKRIKLVHTRDELERFQITSNDFNCSMRLNDSDGNVFTTSFTPGIKKVIEFLKMAFDASIAEVEDKITF